MTVIQFPHVLAVPPQSWQTAELAKLDQRMHGCRSRGHHRLGNRHDRDRRSAALHAGARARITTAYSSVTRLGRVYVLEDGKGQVLFEDGNLTLLAEQSLRCLAAKKAEIVARLTVCWCAVRDFFEEKVEPVLAEPVEFVTHFAPQLAALA